MIKLTDSAKQQALRFIEKSGVSKSFISVALIKGSYTSLMYCGCSDSFSI